MLTSEIRKGDGNWLTERFLVDSGADVTVFTLNVLQRLNLSPAPLPKGFSLVGISSGNSGFVLITTVLQFTRSDGGTVRVNGQFAALTQTTITDYSILGRDVLDIFDVILSRRRNEVSLLAPNHHYHISSP